MQVTLKQAASMSIKYLKAGLVPMLHGSPGIGKSAIVHEIARANDLFLIDERLAQKDPTDLSGFPHILNGRSTYLPPMSIPLESDELPKMYDSKGNPVLDDKGNHKHYKGWLLFLDELNSAPQSVQVAAYKLILDRMVGQDHLHKRCAIMAAGNLETDNAIVMTMSTALQSRLVHIELMNDHEEWLDWAQTHGIHHMITSYIKFKPGNLYAFNPDHTDKTYACNRTWDFANKVLNVTSDNDPDRLPMLAGAISEGVAREFVGFTKIYKDLPDIKSIIDSPEMVRVPDEPSVLYALTGSIAHHITTDNLTAIQKYVMRLPAEFQVVCLKEAVKRNNGLMQHPAIVEWITTQAKKLF